MSQNDYVSPGCNGIRQNSGVDRAERRGPSNEHNPLTLANSEKRKNDGSYVIDGNQRDRRVELTLKKRA
jgi:hypothetical protein